MRQAAPLSLSEPPRDCPLCPRLVEFRLAQRAAHPDWHNAPVRNFGPTNAKLLIVGLAPGMHGANRTGRPFTADYAGDLLYATLLEFGFATGKYEARPDDSLRLTDARIVNSVRCLPPENKPTGGEIANCRRFLLASMAEMKNIRVVVALGRIAHESFLRSIGQPLLLHRFAHGTRHELGPYTLIDSYHCSRYNTNTRRLTADMFRDVFREARALIG